MSEKMMEDKKYKTLTCICFFVVAIINITLPGYLNGFSLDIGINLHELWENETAEFYYYERLNDPVFAKRPVMLAIQAFCNEYLEVPFQASFNLVNFFSLIANCLLIKKISIHFGSTKRQSYYGVLYYLTSFPIMFAFTAYTSTYDDIIQHFLLLLSMLFMICNNLLFSLLFFLFALIVRETSIIFIPFFFICSDRKNNIYKICTLLIVVLLWAYVMNNSGNNNHSIEFLTNNRFFAWKDNFATTRNTIEVFICLILVVIFPLYMLYNSKVSKNKLKKYLNWLFTIIIINTVIIMTTALVQETRLLFLPLLGFAPIFFKLFEDSDISKNIEFLKIKLSAKFLSFAFLLAIIIFVVYSPSIGRSGIVYKLSAIVYLFAYFLFLKHGHFKALLKNFV